MTDRQRALRAYSRAWSLHDEGQIRQALADCWTAGSSYISPLTDEVHGIDGLVGLILDFPVMFPGARLRATSTPVVNRHAALFTWELTSRLRILTNGEDYGRRLAGVDVAEFDPDARIRKVTAFFGVEARPVAAPAAVADVRVTRADGHAPAQ